MGEMLRKWENGKLPRQAWGDGWWELEAGSQSKWKRVDVRNAPTWGEYTEATKEIKEIIYHF
ncbi:hypothetical protein ABW20_dc0108653 [Dactylellina cionopaga]|nr:hypothetical protein ABW20_dc0108653 [Dactylellina cionopaga]